MLKIQIDVEGENGTMGEGEDFIAVTFGVYVTLWEGLNDVTLQAMVADVIIIITGGSYWECVLAFHTMYKGAAVPASIGNVTYGDTVDCRAVQYTVQYNQYNTSQYGLRPCSHVTYGDTRSHGL